MENSENWKTKTLAIGAIIGLAAGLLAAYLMVKKAEQSETRPQLNAGDGIKIGLGVLGVLRLISDSSVK